MREPIANHYRDAWCGELSSARVGDTVRVAGWVHNRRDHGGLIFVDLRDRSGLLQLVFHPETATEAFQAAEALRSEHVLSATGTIVAREAGKENPNLATGQIELNVSEMQVLAGSETPPFPVNEDTPVDELLRLRHRVIDLRRERMRTAVELRHRVVRAIRDHLADHDFLDIETPTLTRSTPEARASSSSPRGSRPAPSTRCPSRPSSTSRC